MRATLHSTKSQPSFLFLELNGFCYCMKVKEKCGIFEAKSINGYEIKIEKEKEKKVKWKSLLLRVDLRGDKWVWRVFP